MKKGDFIILKSKHKNIEKRERINRLIDFIAKLNRIRILFHLWP